MTRQAISLQGSTCSIIPMPFSVSVLLLSYDLNHCIGSYLTHLNYIDLANQICGNSIAAQLIECEQLGMISATQSSVIRSTAAHHSCAVHIGTSSRSHGRAITLPLSSSRTINNYCTDVNFVQKCAPTDGLITRSYTLAAVEE